MSLTIQILVVDSQCQHVNFRVVTIPVLVAIMLGRTRTDNNFSCWLMEARPAKRGNRDKLITVVGSQDVRSTI